MDGWMDVKLPVTARCCHVVNDLRNFAGDRRTKKQTNRRTLPLRKAHTWMIWLSQNNPQIMIYLLRYDNEVVLRFRQAVWPPGSADTVCPRPPLTLTFDRMTLKLARESHLRWGTFLPNLGTPLGSRIIRYVRDGRTDGLRDKGNAYCPRPCGRGHNN